MKLLALTLLTLLLLSPLTLLAKPSQPLVQFHFRDGGRMILLDMKVNGKAATVLLDTGADLSIFRNVKRISIELTPTHFQELTVVDLEQVSPDARRKILGITPSIDGILGEDFLRQFQSVSIDYRTHIVELLPRQRSSLVDRRNAENSKRRAAGSRC